MANGERREKEETRKEEKKEKGRGANCAKVSTDMVVFVRARASTSFYPQQYSERTSLEATNEQEQRCEVSQFQKVARTTNAVSVTTSAKHWRQTR